jgi:hypothetical protein
MTPQDLRATLQALRASDHAFKGVRPADSTPANTPAFLLEDNTVGALDYAASAAVDHWPECGEWNLIASDEQVGGKDGWPAGLISLESPVVLAKFSGRSGA